MLPQPWACYLLVPLGGLVVFEILAGPAAATYVFEVDIAVVGSYLQALHARRAPLALSDAEARLTPANPYRLALRRWSRCDGCAAPLEPGWCTTMAGTRRSNRSSRNCLRLRDVAVY